MRMLLAISHVHIGKRTLALIYAHAMLITRIIVPTSILALVHCHSEHVVLFRVLRL